METRASSSRAVDNQENAVVLNEDVKLLVVEYITIPSDLQALCLVSRSWNPSATRALYRTVVLDLGRPHSQATGFERCMKRGAQQHLKHARELTFYDASEIGERRALKKRVGDNTQATVQRILKLLPDNRLITFRYASHRPLWKSSMRHLEQHQKSIKNIHTDSNMHGVGCDLMAFAAKPQAKITSTFGCTETEFIDFLKQLTSLEFLGLNFRHAPSHTRFWRSEPDKLEGPRISTKVLQMYGEIDFHFGHHMQKMFDWSVMTTLILIEVQHIDLFINAFALSSRICNLVHLECRLSRYWNDQDIGTMSKFFQGNTKLVHVLLSVPGAESALHLQPAQTTFQATVYPLLWPLGDQLETFACHDPEVQGVYGDYPTTTFLPWLEDMCRNLPRLREFGMYAPSGIEEDPWEDDTWADHSWVDDMMGLMGPLSYLKELKMLHFYADPVYYGTEHELSWYDKHETLDTETFATSLFRWARTHCPQLEVLAWGAHHDFRNVKDYSTKRLKKNEDFDLQLFFVRRQEPSGRTFALRTTRSRIRDEFPELRLPKFDPGWNDLHQILMS